MHLKNFSLYNLINGYTLTPAYDMLSTALVIPESGVEEKVIENLARRFSRALPKWFELIDQSFLPDDMKRQYKKLILRRVVMLR